MAGEPAQHTTITIPEIADRLDVCEETVYDLCKRHMIPSIRPGRRFIISRTAYEKWEATIGTDKPFDVHHNTRPDCRGFGARTGISAKKRCSPARNCSHH